MSKLKRFLRVSVPLLVMLVFVQVAVSNPWSSAVGFIGSIIGVMADSTETSATRLGEKVQDRLAPQADQYFAGDGSTLTAAKWGASSAGPFTAAFAPGNVANFSTLNGTGTGGSITVGGVNATENFTITAAGGTISNQGNLVVPINVAAGKTLDFSGNAFTTSGTAGYNFTGPGTLAMTGGTFGGGFTINSGTLVARGINAMGGAATNVLNINGGIITANASLNFTGKYGGGINVGGDFQLGALSTSVPLSLDSANLTFSNNISLGNSTRTITIGANGSYLLSGIISGGPGAGLTIAKLPGTVGVITMNGVNTYTGATTVANGSLSLSQGASIANSAAIEIGSGGQLDIANLTNPMTLSSGQALRGNGSSATGSLRMSATKGLTTAADSPVQFPSFNGVTPPLTLVNAGTLTLKSSNPVSVTVTNGGTPLPVGDYKLIAKSGTATVSGTPTSVTVNGDGIAAGASASLQNVSGELFLHIVPGPGTLQFSSATYSGSEGGGSIALTVTRTGGSSGSVGAQVTVADITATGGTTLCSDPVEDYTQATYAVSFGDGETSKTVSVAICNDPTDESNETFIAHLGSVSGGGTLGIQNSATVTIVDDDWTVTSVADTNDGLCDADCSLREAIAAAAPGDTIRFSSLFNSAQTITTGSELLISSKNLNIVGPGANLLKLDGGPLFHRSFSIADSSVMISGMSMTGGDGVGSIAYGDGGAVLVLNGTVGLDGVHIYGNTPPGLGGGVEFVGGSGHTIKNSTISSNVGGTCGGVSLVSGASLTITNTTVSGNSANGSAGGLCNINGTLAITNSTITGNSSNEAGGLFAYGPVTIGSTIVAGNNGVTFPEIEFMAGSVNSLGFNLIGDSPGDVGNTNNPVTYQPTDILDTDPQLEALDYWGGPVPTHALKRSPASPAQDKGFAFGLATDQNGQSRTIDDSAVDNAVGGDGTDIGATEGLAPTAAPTSVSGRVRTADGRGIMNAMVTIEGGGLASPIRTVTSSFGAFRFDNVPAGQTYIVTVKAKRYTFANPTRTISMTDELAGLDFVGER